jgi:hypothetical protein
MLSGIYIAIFSAFTLVSCVLAFLVGRCARKLPFLDDRVPWTMRRGQAAVTADDTWTACEDTPQNALVNRRQIPQRLDMKS